ncbi:unnamed protein product, partial [Iphiclides podalirius]
MSYVRAAALLCACALMANVATKAAPAPPRRSENKDSNVVQDKTIAVRRMPIAYFYPFSLWPLPRYPNRDRDDSEVKYRYRRSLQIYQIKNNER